MKKIILLGLIAAVPPGYAAEGAKKIEVHGHRGTRGTRPENTLAAFREALRAGVDVLEFDMVVTADGAVAISHDKNVNPEICLGPGGAEMDGPVPIISLKLAELKAYDCGSKKNPRFPEQVPAPGERIPALAEVFELVRRTTGPVAAAVNFNMETKITPGEPELSPPPAEFARSVVDVVKKYGMEERVIIQSFDWRTLAEVRKLSARIRLSQLTEGDQIDPELLAGTGADILSPWHVWMTKEYVAAMHKAGKKVAPWTLNGPKDWQRALDYGVDAIITDYPAKLIAWLKEKKLR